MEFQQQLERIKAKLQKAKIKDRELKVFGADNHLYEFNAPISNNEVKNFEEENDIKLPPDYIAFVTSIGNGGPGSYGGAGPYYGIYPLGEFGYMLINAATMSAPAVINSSLTNDKWSDLTAFDEEEKKDTSEYDRQYDALFNGLMTIGTQGCNGQTMLILNGKDCGRVVSIDQDLYMPVMATQKNFLDWYEAWLDKILSS